MMFIAKKALPRRTFLRAMGTAIGLPLLDAMVPALAAQAPRPARRFGFVYIANGVIQDQWRPKTAGTAFELPAILQPFAPVRDQLLHQPRIGTQLGAGKLLGTPGGNLRAHHPQLPLLEPRQHRTVLAQLHGCPHLCRDQ